MEQNTSKRWLYIALFIAAVLIGGWMVFDLILDRQMPEATPTPRMEETASPAAETPATSPELTPSPEPQATPPAGTPPVSRERAADFSLTNLEGDTVTLSAQQGRVTVVNFWGTWCGWCMYEMPEFAEMVAHYGEDVSFLFVNYGDDADTARQAMEEFGIPLNTVLMQDGEISDLYEVQGYPTTLVLDKWGGIAETYLGAATKDEIMPVIDGLLAE